MVVPDVQRQLPRHLVARLVEARQRAPRADRAEEGVHVAAGGLALAVDAAAAHAIDRRAECDVDRQRAGRELAIGREADEVIAAGDHARGVAVERGAIDRQVGRVEPDHAGRPHDLGGDADPAGGARLVGDDGQVDGVAHRRDIARQAQRGRRVGALHRGRPGRRGRRRRCGTDGVGRRASGEHCDESATHGGHDTRRSPRGRRDSPVAGWSRLRHAALRTASRGWTPLRVPHEHVIDSICTRGAATSRTRSRCRSAPAAWAQW